MEFVLVIGIIGACICLSFWGAYVFDGYTNWLKAAPTILDAQAALERAKAQRILAEHGRLSDELLMHNGRMLSER